MSSYTVNKIDTNQLESYANDFEKCMTSFLSKHQAFQNSYLMINPKENIQIMSKKIDNIYSDIENSYKNIKEWWFTYNKNIVSLDKNIGQIYGGELEGPINSFVGNHFIELKKYNLIFSDTIKSNHINLVDYTNNVTSSVSLDGIKNIDDNIKRTINADSLFSIYNDKNETNTQFNYITSATITHGLAQNLVGGKTVPSKWLTREDVTKHTINSEKKMWNHITNIAKDVGATVSAEVISLTSDMAASISNIFNKKENAKIMYESRDLSNHKESLSSDKYAMLLVQDERIGNQIVSIKNEELVLKKQYETMENKVINFQVMTGELYNYTPEKYASILDGQYKNDYHMFYSQSDLYKDRIKELEQEKLLKIQQYLENYNSALLQYTGFNSNEEYQKARQDLQTKLSDTSYLIYNLEQYYGLLPYSFIQETDNYKDFTYSLNEKYNMSYDTFIRNEQMYYRVEISAPENFGGMNNNTSPNNNTSEQILREMGFQNEEEYQEFSNIYFLSEKNKKLYFYLKETNPASASQFITSMQDTINQARGAAEAAIFLDTLKDSSDPGAITGNFLKTFKQGTGDGIQTFFMGIENVIAADGVISSEDYKKMLILQSLSENENYVKYLPTTYQFSTSFGNMIPAMAASVVVSALATPVAGKIVGSSLMGLSAMGNATEGSMQQGNDKFESYLYGGFVGISETTLSYFLGKIPGLSETSGFTLSNFISEGTEEALQEGVDAILRSTILGEEINVKDLASTSSQSFAMGFVMAAFLNGGQVIINEGTNRVVMSSAKINEILETRGVEGLKEFIISDSSNNKIENKDKLIDDNAKYNLSERFSEEKEYYGEHMEDYDEMGFVSNKTGLQLEKMFFDEDYVVGVHAAGLADGNAIMQDGLHLTGHLASGHNNSDISYINLEHNIQLFNKKNPLQYFGYLANLKSSCKYKSFGKNNADALIIKIPKADISNIEKLVVSDATGFKLKSEYIYGMIHSDQGNLGDIVLNPISLQKFQ